MSIQAQTHTNSRGKRVSFLILRIALALAFIGAGCFKLSGAEAAIDEFNRVGLGQIFRYLTAAAEISGAILLLWPRTIFFGAILLCATCVGAIVAILTVLHIDVIHAIFLALIFAAIAWSHRQQLTQLF